MHLLKSGLVSFKDESARPVVLLIALVLSAGCASERILTNSPDFRAVDGKHFTLLKECYIFREVRERHKYPFVGFNSLTPGIGIPGFPRNAKEFVGKRVNSVEILGVLPKGTTFTVVQLRQVSGFENTVTSFDIAPDGALGKKWPVLDGIWLTNDGTSPVTFFAEIVEQLGQ
jgi:hypothetical protein